MLVFMIYSVTDKLYVDKIDENAQYLPSPEQLKHRLIIKVRLTQISYFSCKLFYSYKLHRSDKLHYSYS